MAAVSAPTPHDAYMQAAKRTCAASGCRTILRSSNPDDYCSVHLDPRVDQSAQRAGVRAGSQAQKVLEAMPGTARQLAGRTERPLKATRVLITYCTQLGLAVGVSRTCEGCGNDHTFYERSGT